MSKISIAIHLRFLLLFVSTNYSEGGTIYLTAFLFSQFLPIDIFFEKDCEWYVSLESLESVYNLIKNS